MFFACDAEFLCRFSNLSAQHINLKSTFLPPVKIGKKCMGGGQTSNLKNNVRFVSRPQKPLQNYFVIFYGKCFLEISKHSAVLEP